MNVFRCLAVICLLCFPAALFAQSVPVPKTNPMKVYVHYMPWFQSPLTLGANNWGYHWKMNTRNPNIIGTNGQRQIASNYYPLIGPYDSTDKDVLEYHMLLMKVCGIDGVIVDWYGSKGTNGDINSLLSAASNTIVNQTANYGLNFGVCLEDRFASSTNDVKTNISYLQQNYFTKPNYIRQGGATNSPLMLVFGPITYQQPSQWNTILSGGGEKPAVVPLQYQGSQVGSNNAAGEFGWVYQSASQPHLTVQKNFLQLEAPKYANSIGVAYPGYNDYYAQGGAGAGAGFTIPENNGQTLTDTLGLDSAYSSNIAAVQLATWNDFGEGTMLEPTVENGFSSLLEIQQFTGVPYGISELQLVYQLYEARKDLAGNARDQAFLDQAAADINRLDFGDARTALTVALTIIPEPAYLPLFAAAFVYIVRRSVTRR